jgi:hypothetical protein
MSALSLSSLIMRIPVPAGLEYDLLANKVEAYKLGHRDARNSAAELAGAASALIAEQKSEIAALRQALASIRDQSSDIDACECAADALIDSRSPALKLHANISNRCLACGGHHPGMSGLPCPKMDAMALGQENQRVVSAPPMVDAIMNISCEKSQAISARGRDAMVGDADQVHHEPTINFDMERMEKALAGERYLLPQGLTKKQIREHLIAHARRLRSEGEQ